MDTPPTAEDPPQQAEVKVQVGVADEKMEADDKDAVSAVPPTKGKGRGRRKASGKEAKKKPATATRSFFGKRLVNVVENEHYSTVGGLIRLVISLECFIEIIPDFLCPFMND